MSLIPFVVYINGMRHTGQRRRGRGYGRWRWIHGWLGLVAGVLLLIQGVTGALLGYERELRDFLGDGKRTGTGPRLHPGELVEGLEEELGDGEARWLLWFGDPGEPVWVSWEAGAEQISYRLDPWSGEVLAGTTRWHRFFEGVLRIHRNLGTGRPGQVLMGSSALILLSLVLTGAVLQVKRSRTLRELLGLRRRQVERSGPARWRWWHSLLGVWTTPFLLLLALTGPVWSFETYRGLLELLTFSETISAEAPQPGEGNPRTEVNRKAIIAGAEALIPETGAMRFLFPATPEKAARFEWAPLEAPHENFRSRAYLDPLSGDLLRIEPLADYSRAESLMRWAYPLHTGRWGGGLTQALTTGASLAIPFFVLSGLLLYIKRTK